MIRQDTLPVEFQGLQGKVSYIQKVNNQEWSSNCPSCGGAPHKDGVFPDRFRMWTNANGKNKVMGWCRSCSYVWFPKNDIPLTHEQFEAWRKTQIEIEERKRKEAENAIKLLRSQKLWEFYHAELDEWSYGILNGWGILKENVDFWKLGLIKDYVVKSGENSYHSPAIAIPVWGFDGEVQNIKVRVLDPQNDKDRYRYVYKVGRDCPFVAMPGLETDTCLVVEGEKKAMVVYSCKQDIQVVGVPSKSPSASSLRQLDPFKKIYLCLDPDAKYAENKSEISPLRRMVDILDRSRVKIIHLPGKVDDLILKHGLNLDDALRYAK